MREADCKDFSEQCLARRTGRTDRRTGGIVALGPEGHRSPGGLTQGQTGVGYLASRAGVPVVPMAAWGQERLGVSWQRLQRAPVHVRFGPPVSCPAAVAPGRATCHVRGSRARATAAWLYWK